MSVKVKESLFELIRSMTKSEKRYFKLMASRHTIGKENNYVVLFDFIDKQSSYDEDELFKVFKGEAFLNKFSITKKRLYDHILYSLDAFHTSSSAEAQLYRQLHAARVLFRKSLYDQARRALNSAEKQARKLEDVILLQKVSELRKELVENEGYSEETSIRISEIASNDAQNIDRMGNHSLLWQLKSELLAKLRQNGVCRTEEDQLFFKAALDRLPSRDSLCGFKSQYLYNQIHSICSYAEQSHQDARFWIGENIALFRANTDRISEDPPAYASLLTNAIYIDEILGNKAESNRLLNELRSLPVSYATSINEDQEVKLFGSINSVELGVYMKRGELDAALLLVPAIERELSRLDNRLSPTRRAFICFQIASAYLGSGEFGSALKWINKILNDPELHPSEDILAFTYLIDLLVHLELGHKELIPYALKNTQRFLKSRNKLHGFERLLLNYISKISKCQHSIDSVELWEGLTVEIGELEAYGYERAALDYFDFRSWAESRATRRSFSEVVKSRNMRSVRNAS